MCKKPPPPTVSSDGEDIITRVVRLVEGREASLGDSGKNRKNDEVKNQITEKERKEQ